MKKLYTLLPNEDCERFKVFLTLEDLKKYFCKICKQIFEDADYTIGSDECSPHGVLFCTCGDDEYVCEYVVMEMEEEDDKS